ncbi:MAG: hypothetical protein ACOVNQ_13225 [Pirellula sp.]
MPGTREFATSADGGRGFLTALTLVTALTGLTADMVDEVDIIG